MTASYIQQQSLKFQTITFSKPGELLGYLFTPQDVFGNQRTTTFPLVADTNYAIPSHNWCQQPVCVRQNKILLRPDERLAILNKFEIVITPNST